MVDPLLGVKNNEDHRCPLFDRGALAPIPAFSSEPEARTIELTSIVATILAHIIKYLTGIWTCARMIFDVLPAQTMEDCIGLLCVVFLISIIDGLPDMLRRRKKKDKDGSTEMI